MRPIKNTFMTDRIDSFAKCKELTIDVKDQCKGRSVLIAFNVTCQIMQGA